MAAIPPPKEKPSLKYAELIHDEYSDLVEEIFEYGKLKWRYLVPDDPADRPDWPNFASAYQPLKIGPWKQAASFLWNAFRKE